MANHNNEPTGRMVIRKEENVSSVLLRNESSVIECDSSYLCFSAVDGPTVAWPISASNFKKKELAALVGAGAANGQHWQATSLTVTSAFFNLWSP